MARPPGLNNKKWLSAQLQHQSLADIAANLGVQEVQVRRACQRFGLDVPAPPPKPITPPPVPPPRALDEETPEWLAHMFLDRRWSKAQIAQVTSATVREVDRALKMHDIVRRRKHPAWRSRMPDIYRTHTDPPAPAVEAERQAVDAEKQALRERVALNHFRLIGEVLAPLQRVPGQAVPTAEVRVRDPGSPVGQEYVLVITGEEAIRHAATRAQPGTFIYSESKLVLTFSRDHDEVTLRCLVRRGRPQPGPWNPADGALVGTFVSLRQRDPYWLVVARDGEEYTVKLQGDLGATIADLVAQEQVVAGDAVFLQGGGGEDWQWLSEGLLITVDAETYDPSPRTLNNLSIVGQVKHPPKFYTTNDGRDVFRAFVTWYEDQRTHSAMVYAWDDAAHAAYATMPEGETIFAQGTAVVKQWRDRNTGQPKTRLEVQAFEITTDIETDETVRQAVFAVERASGPDGKLPEISDLLDL